MTGPTIDQQIAELKREIALRKNVLPKQVAAGRMRQAEMDHHMAAMTAALHTVMAVKRLRATFAEHRFRSASSHGASTCACGWDAGDLTPDAFADWLDHIFERSKADAESSKT